MNIHDLERPQGGFAMIALDQRGSMRDLLGERGTDDGMRTFKRQAAEALSPYGSAVLLDRLYGVADGRPSWVAPECKLILAVDVFEQEPGRPVAETSLDTEVTPDFVAGIGAAALKFLLLWNREQSAAERADVVGGFLALSRDCGVPAILEAIVRNGDGPWTSSEERDDAVVEAAAELGGLGADLYKAEVPTYGLDLERTEARAREITAVLNCPWVVLSNGVAPDGFADAVAASCRGGASGFLAGRAVWTQATALSDWAQSLATESVERLRRLDAVVPATR
jgi:sulfofructosephosphate aldolase